MKNIDTLVWTFFFRIYILEKMNLVNQICMNLCRLYNYGIGIHLIENPALDEYDTVNELRPINPKDNHISFQVRKYELKFGKKKKAKYKH